VTVRFIQITDHHLAQGDLLWGYSTGHALRRVLAHIAEHAGPLDFIISTGDLVEHGTEHEYRAFLELIGAAPGGAFPGPLRAHGQGLGGVPFYAIPGNHDVRPLMANTMFPASPPAERLQGWFEQGGVRFVCVDWGGENKATPAPGLAEYLNLALDGTPAVLLMHHHIAPMGHPRLDALIADEVAEFADRIAGCGVLAILSGHTHATFERSLAGMPAFGLRSTCFQFAPGPGDSLLRCIQPLHYRVVTIADGALTTEVVEVSL
jgi:3',5'-cyclic-AMP phosphodiesterase